MVHRIRRIYTTILSQFWGGGGGLEGIVDRCSTRLLLPQVIRTMYCLFLSHPFRCKLFTGFFGAVAWGVLPYVAQRISNSVQRALFSRPSYSPWYGFDWEYACAIACDGKSISNRCQTSSPYSHHREEASIMSHHTRWFMTWILEDKNVFFY